MPAEKRLYVYLTIVRYPKRYRFFALLAMAVHRLPLLLNRGIYFWKLLGSGHGGGFRKKPDWQQWALLVVKNNSTVILTQTDNHLLKTLYGAFIAGWMGFFKCETCTFSLEPMSGHGKWDGQDAFGTLPAHFETGSPVAVLTRATVSLKKLNRFWQHVDAMNALLEQAPGLRYSVSIGEIPFIKQATFSIWQNSEALTNFAYAMRGHIEVIKKTRQENWYTEELFARFKIIHITGSINGIHPYGNK